MINDSIFKFEQFKKCWTDIVCLLPLLFHTSSQTDFKFLSLERIKATKAVSFSFFGNFVFDVLCALSKSRSLGNFDDNYGDFGCAISAFRFSLSDVKRSDRR